MRMCLLAVGTRMPAWVKAGFDEYAVRFPRECPLQLLEIPAGKRSKPGLLERLVREEGARILAAAPKGARLIALDAGGRQWNTEQLAFELAHWRQEGRDLAFMIGGPDGLDSVCRARAELTWSLSRLTLPHPLVRIIVAEQLYRALSLLQQHPYHRG
ncbi:MAG: 23S rRNA (pseudouridine(1915)-N(3))-methyltransferase RlmH [Candidatus Competibacteraceae bacterium]